MRLQRKHSPIAAHPAFRSRLCRAIKSCMRRPTGRRAESAYIIRCWGTGDDGARPGSLGHLANGAQAVGAMSLELMITPVRLRNRTPTNYALGVSVLDDNGHPRLVHGGAVSGFVSLNTVWLDQGTAVVVFSKEDGSPAPRTVTNRIATLLL